MAWPLVRLKRPAFVALNLTIMTLEWICLTVAIVLFIAAIYMWKNLSQYINMLSNNDGYTLPLMFLIIAILAIPTHLLGIFMNVKIQDVNANNPPVVWLFYAAIATLSIAMCTFCIIVIGFLHMHHLQDDVHNGIVKNMKSYIHKGESSKDIDVLQMHFQCCGSKTYREWFYVRWDERMHEPSSPGEFISDDVPYSCCLQTSMHPCVHNSIKSSSHIYRYDPPHSPMISKQGCHAVIISATRKQMLIINTLLILLIILEFFLCVAKRFQQTALSRQSKGDDGSFVYRAWLFGKDPGRSSSEIENVSLLRDEAVS